MKALLDVNILIALAWPNHVHHGPAHRWFAEHKSYGWATCPATQSRFVRISSNRKVIPEAQTPREALALLRRITRLEGHDFWMDDLDLASSPLIAEMGIWGHRQVADGHLLALAIRHDGRLATLDKGLLSLVPKGHQAEKILQVIPAY